LSALDLQAIAEETEVACFQAVARVPESATGVVDSRAIAKLWSDLFGPEGPGDAQGEIIATEQVYESLAGLVRTEPRAEGLPGYRILPGEPDNDLGQAAVGGEE
jgi:hypothetical protein